MCKRLVLLFTIILLGVPGAGPAVQASDFPPVCEPGYTLVEEVCYKDVVTKVCKMVPETKKNRKTVYDCKVEEYCVPKCPSLFAYFRKGCANDCADCEPPRYRRILVKKEVVEECLGWKCVVEEVVERVPYTVYRKVPCAPAPAPAMPPPLP